MEKKMEQEKNIGMENYYLKGNIYMEKKVEKEKNFVGLTVNYYLKVYIQMGKGMEKVKNTTKMIY